MRQQRLAKIEENDYAKQTLNFWTPITERKEVSRNMDLFHCSNEYAINQCTVCLEAWPLKPPSNNVRTSEYRCLTCSRDKKQPKKFSKQNNMTPSTVPCQLQGLTQVEEMLIACALPVMRVYVRPGGQRGLFASARRRTIQLFTKISKTFISYTC